MCALQHAGDYPPPMTLFPNAAPVSLASLTEQLTRIEEKIDTFISAKDPEVIGASEAMRRLGLHSYAAFSRKRKELKIPSLARGRYRTRDITNALAHRALFPPK